MNKRIKGIKEHPTDIIKSVVKRAFKIGDKEANKRMDICRDCDSNVKDEVFGGYMCQECYCPIKNLIHSDKGCDLNKW